MNQSNRYFKKLCLPILVISVALGCGSGKLPPSKGHQNNAIMDNTGSSVIGILIYVDEFVNSANKFENQLVTIRGVFMGWEGSCEVPPPETRSDWMMEYNGACIYISGPTPLSIDIIPNSKDIGKEIDIYGRVLLDKRGVPYIKIINQ